MSDERTVRVTVTELSAGLFLSGKGAVEIGKKLKYGQSIDLDITYRPVPPPPERRIYEVEVRKPKKGERTLCNDGGISLAATDLTTPWPVILSERTPPAPSPVKRRVRKLELRQRRKGDKYMLCNEYTAEYDLDGLVWVIVEETEEEVSDGE